MDDWQKKYEEQCRKDKIKAQKAWDEKYSKLEPQETWKDGDSGIRITFLDWVKETDDEVKTKTTVFTFFAKNKGAVEYMHSYTSKSQRFFVATGPLAGQRKTVEQAGEDYYLFNYSTRDWKNEGIPHVILVHKDNLK
jgi:hypothetical protein